MEATPSLKVAVNARLLTSPSLRGWSRYALNLLAELPAQGVELLLYADAPLAPEHAARLPGAAVRVAPRRRYLAWEQVWLPRQCARDRVEVLHCPLNFGLPLVSPCPRVLTLHDAIPQVFARARQPLRQRLSRAALLSRAYHAIARRAADEVITPSEHAKGDLVRHLGLSPDRVTVIAEAADPRFHAPVEAAARERVRRTHDLPPRYVLYLGGCEERKNVPLLVEAFARARPAGLDLVIAGARTEEKVALSAQARGLGVEARVRLLGWVVDEDLPALYAEAEVFVNPSRYEGFGLQLVEAMAVGVPVLAARATSLPEVLGDGGELFSPDDPAELAAQLARLAADPAERERLRARARARSARFSWRRAAEETVAVYHRALSRRR